MITSFLALAAMADPTFMISGSATRDGDPGVLLVQFERNQVWTRRFIPGSRCVGFLRDGTALLMNMTNEITEYTLGEAGSELPPPARTLGSGFTFVRRDGRISVLSPIGEMSTYSGDGSIEVSRLTGLGGSIAGLTTDPFSDRIALRTDGNTELVGLKGLARWGSRDYEIRTWVATDRALVRKFDGGQEAIINPDTTPSGEKVKWRAPYMKEVAATRDLIIGSDMTGPAFEFKLLNRDLKPGMAITIMGFRLTGDLRVSRVEGMIQPL